MNCFFKSSRILRRSLRILARANTSKTYCRSFTMSTNNDPEIQAEPEPSPPIAKGVAVHKPRFIDIGINLTDPIYTGHYHGTQRHDSDLYAVVARARSIGCEKLIVTGSDVEESRKAVELAKEYPGTIYATVGVHPCHCKQFTRTPTSATSLLTSLRTLALSAKSSSHAVAFGEIGLDYDRLPHCDKETQLKYFAAQLDIAVEVQLPLFLHSRAAHEDFLRILSEREEKLPKRGVVHSFTGTKEEMLELVSHGWDIGVNGCSLKTAENCEVVRAIPLERLQLETDGPWCEMRPTHAGSAFAKNMGFEENNGSPWKWVKKEKWVEGALVKGRNEPCLIEKVAWAVAGIKGLTVQDIAEVVWENTVRMFRVGDTEVGNGKAR